MKPVNEHTIHEVPFPAGQIVVTPVSYTHLDVYKRQKKDRAASIIGILYGLYCV